MTLKIFCRTRKCLTGQGLPPLNNTFEKIKIYILFISQTVESRVGRGALLDMLVVRRHDVLHRSDLVESFPERLIQLHRRVNPQRSIGQLNDSRPTPLKRYEETKQQKNTTKEKESDALRRMRCTFVQVAIIHTGGEIGKNKRTWRVNKIARPRNKHGMKQIFDVWTLPGGLAIQGTPMSSEPCTKRGCTFHSRRGVSSVPLVLYGLIFVFPGNCPRIFELPLASIFFTYLGNMSSMTTAGRGVKQLACDDRSMNPSLYSL